MFLRQSTSQVVRFGPCLDKTDNVTEETGLTLAQADMRLSKDGGVYAQKNASGNATHDSNGHYSTTLDATDTATVGILTLSIQQPANMLPVQENYYVVEEAVYDNLYAASATGPATKADVKTEIDAGLRTTTDAEPSSMPAAASSIADKIGILFTTARNKGKQTSSLKTLFADDGTTIITTWSVTDDGTTFTRGAGS